MNLKQFHYALTLYKIKNFTRAAEKLNITQPSLSQYIKKIENQVGCKLFERNGADIILTEMGKVYIDIGRKMLDLENQMSNRLLDLKEYRTGTLAIGIAPYRNAWIMPNIVNKFRRLYPGIKLELKEYTTAELKEGAEYGEFDLCISTLPIDETIFYYDLIMREDLLIAVPKGSPEDLVLSGKCSKDVRKASISLRDIEGYPFISLPKGQVLGETFEQILLNNDVSVTKAVECTSVEATHSMVRSGIGLALIPSSIAKYDTSNAVSYYHLKEKVPQRSVITFYRKAQYLSDPAKAMINLLKSID